MPTTDMEIFQAEMQRARDLGLDLNKLNIDALNDSIVTGDSLNRTSGLNLRATSNSKDIIETHGDTAFFVYNVPKSGDSQIDTARLQEMLDAEDADEGLGTTLNSPRATGTRVRDFRDQGFTDEEIVQDFPHLKDHDPQEFNKITPKFQQVLEAQGITDVKADK